MGLVSRYKKSHTMVKGKEMSKRGKQKKAENVEKRRLQMEEALECLTIKQAAETQMAFSVKRKPKQCTFRYCRQYVDPSCTVCPYCGNPLESGEPIMVSTGFVPLPQG